MALEAGGGDRQEPEWNAVLHGRYVRDFSFENPGAAAAVDKDAVHIDISARVDSRRSGGLHEVTLTIAATAVQEAEIVFLAELVYAGLFELIGLGEEARRRFTVCEAPRILFPFADRIIADAAREGGYPPLSLTPPDFPALYRQDRASSRKRPGGADGAAVREAVAAMIENRRLLC